MRQHHWLIDGIIHVAACAIILTLVMGGLLGLAISLRYLFHNVLKAF